MSPRLSLLLRTTQHIEGTTTGAQTSVIVAVAADPDNFRSDCAEETKENSGTPKIN